MLIATAAKSSTAAAAAGLSLLINNAYTGRLKSETAMKRDRDRERESAAEREGETKRGNVAHCLLIL